MDNGATLNLGTFSDTVQTLGLNQTSTLAATISGGAGQIGNLTVNSSISLINLTSDPTEGPTLSLSLGTGFTLPPTGTVFMLIHNNGHAFVSGRFASIADGSTIVVGGHHFRVSYFGGTSGCDITLTSLD